MKRRLVIIVIVLAIPVAAALLLFSVPGRVGGELASHLAERLGQDVDITSLRWVVGPEVHIEGEGLSANRQAADGRPPLVAVDSFAVHSDLGALFQAPRQIQRIELQGLRVHVPRGRKTGAAGVAKQSGEGARGSAASDPGAGATPLVVEEVVADDAVVEIGSSKPDKPPRVFEVRSLRLGSAALDRPVSFEALVTNPTPPGLVQTHGEFGPWNKEEPSRTPISGDYRFMDADLGQLRGVAGILGSEGSFSGTLGHIAVTGQADVPEFSVDLGAQTVPLETRFEVEVGDKGADVQLKRIDASFLDTKLIVEGEVAKPPGAKGRTVDLDVTSEYARVEDVLRFVVKGEEPPLTGDMVLDTRLVIPPGQVPVMARMQATGSFEIAEGRFSNLDVQKTLERLSRVTARQSEGEEGSSVVSNLKGAFELKEGTVHFSELGFEVPGTAVELVGSYGLRDERLDLRGRLLFERSPSEMASGKLGGWIKILDPVLRRGESGVVVPITIGGTRSRPSFRVDYKAWTGDWSEILKQQPR